MKKLLSFIFVLFFIMAASTICALAGSLSDAALPVDGFEITGGIDLQKDAETTFNSSRTISGTAEKDTKVVVTVYDVAGEGEKTTLTEVDSCTATVGLTEIFIQSVDLDVGKNLIVVQAYNGDKYSEASAVIKRKKSEIKNELRQNIVLPGQR